MADIEIDRVQGGYVVTFHTFAPDKGDNRVPAGSERVVIYAFRELTAEINYPAGRLVEIRGLTA